MGEYCENCKKLADEVERLTNRAFSVGDTILLVSGCEEFSCVEVSDGWPADSDGNYYNPEFCVIKPREIAE